MDEEHQWVLGKVRHVDMSGLPGLSIQLEILEGEHIGKLVEGIFVGAEAVSRFEIIQAYQMVEVQLEKVPTGVYQREHRHTYTGPLSLVIREIREADNLKIFKVINKGKR